MYTLKLIVEDATGLLDVILFDAGGDAFFPDLPPRDMAADPAAAAELHRRLMLMLGQGSQRCAAAAGGVAWWI